MAVREGQKARTRQAILHAAGELLDADVDVSIDGLAEASGISRATIYRYFESADDIVWHAISDRATGDYGTVVDAAGPSPVDRIRAAEKDMHDYLFGETRNLRRVVGETVTRVLDGRAETTPRPARRLRYIDVALEPLRDHLDEDEMFRIRHALGMVLGAEAFVALVDVCGVEPDDTRQITSWAAQALVRQAMLDAGLDSDGA